MKSSIMLPIFQDKATPTRIAVGQVNSCYGLGVRLSQFWICYVEG
jgi:hypothetical protein